MSVLAFVPDRAPAAAATAASAHAAAMGSGRSGDGMHVQVGVRPAQTAEDETQRFAHRIRLLVERVGGAGELARRCGVTSRSVRNWCHGRADISRARCLVLAQALHISPLWLISGEGRMSDEPAELHSGDDAQARQPSVDSGRLAAALQILQSYLALTGGSLSNAQRAEAVVALYGLLDRPGPLDAGRMVAFHTMLATWLRCQRQVSVV